MSDPFNMCDDDCWECIAEELEASTNPDLAAELREALRDTLRTMPLSPLEMLISMHRLSIEMTAQACRISFRCKW